MKSNNGLNEINRTAPEMRPIAPIMVKITFVFIVEVSIFERSYYSNLTTVNVNNFEVLSPILHLY